MKSSILLRAPLCAGALALLAGSFAAQTLYGVHGNAPGPTPDVWEINGPPDPAFCNYPNGPVLGTFPTIGGAVCPGLVPFPPPPFLDGDLAVDAVNDLVFATDGFAIAYYGASGLFLDSFFPPLVPLTGMGYDSIGNLLWITDGFTYGAIAPPPAPGCTKPPPPFVMGPFPAPLGPGLFNGFLTDLEWDPGTGSLWGTDSTGVVGNFLPGPIPAPVLGWFPVAPGGACPLLAPPLVGVAVDNARPGQGVVYVTDGMHVGYLDFATGIPIPAAPTFYTTSSCYPLATPPLSGIAFASHANSYGSPSTLGTTLPVAGSVGQTFAGNLGYLLSVSGQTGSLAGLFWGQGGPACPFLPVSGLQLYEWPPLKLVGSGGVPLGGTLVLPAPLSPALPIGLPLDVEWLVIEPSGALSLSDALHLTIALP